MRLVYVWMPRSPQTIAGKIWVTGVTLLIAFIAYSSQVFIIWPWYGSTMSVDLLLLLGPFKYVFSSAVQTKLTHAVKLTSCISVLELSIVCLHRPWHCAKRLGQQLYLLTHLPELNHVKGTRLHVRR